MPTPRITQAALLAAVALAVPPAAGQGFVLTQFEQYLEALRQQARIPGLSAAIVENGHIVWERGFGFGDVENAIRAEPDTPYQVAGLTQTFAARLVLRCAEEGEIELTAPMRSFSTAIPEPGATVRHVLSHTSEGTPGERFRHDPSRYAALAAVVDDCTSQAYRESLARSILDRVGMRDSVPGQNLGTGASRGGFDQAALDRYAAVVGRLAKPYRVDRDGRPSPSEYPTTSIDAADGLISTVRDLARFDAALDGFVLLRQETLAMAWSRQQGPGGQAFPHGLGWFVQSYEGETVVWQFGSWTNASSSLLLKVPRRRLTLILLANSDGLSAPFALSSGDVTVSLFARLFLRLFV